MEIQQPIENVWSDSLMLQYDCVNVLCERPDSNKWAEFRDCGHGLCLSLSLSLFLSLSL